MGVRPARISSARAAQLASFLIIDATIQAGAAVITEDEPVLLRVRRAGA